MSRVNGSAEWAGPHKTLTEMAFSTINKTGCQQATGFFMICVHEPYFGNGILRTTFFGLH